MAEGFGAGSAVTAGAACDGTGGSDCTDVATAAARGFAPDGTEGGRAAELSRAIGRALAGMTGTATWVDAEGAGDRMTGGAGSAGCGGRTLVPAVTALAEAAG